MSLLKKHVRNYTQVANDIINDKRLSLKSKGLYLFLVSKPDNWNFSARLIATQNNDKKASINSALHELEDFGLLRRVPCQGGYDYEIYDKIKPHSTENRLSGKSAKRLPKIDLVENQSSISNKESIAKRIERENTIISPALDLDPRLVDLFLNHVSSSRSVKNKSAYRASVNFSLFTVGDKDHEKTLFAFNDFVSNISVLDLCSGADGLNIFDLIERG